MLVDPLNCHMGLCVTEVATRAHPSGTPFVLNIADQQHAGCILLRN